jgi:competence/damage-inducible protein CinA-like protein
MPGLVLGIRASFSLGGRHNLGHDDLRAIRHRQIQPQFREAAMRIEIICTGDEVLTGKIVNTNFSYIAQKLEDVGLSVRWGTTVGDDRETLLAAFLEAGARADAVIVNGGLGPTVDDLSQEIAARAAGVDLALNEEWLGRMEEFFRRRSRVMSPNNKKQAMLPQGAEILDNPIGTACGFAMDIGQARFFFTPGVPRELRRMLEEQIIPRLLARSGGQTAIRLKRFHSYGLGESHVDALLAGIEALVPDGSAKLGFRAHYPQIETKLTVRGIDEADIEAKLAPVVAEVRKRLGNFILAEDDDTLEGVILKRLQAENRSLAVVEMFTSGGISQRIAPLPGAERVFRRGIVARDLGELWDALPVTAPAEISREGAAAAAEAARAAGADYALAVLIDLDDGPDRIDFGGTICLAVAGADGAVESRRARILGGREWVRLGAVELGLDCLRRYLCGLPVSERIDFERS